VRAPYRDGMPGATRMELAVCAVRGHFVPGASVDPLREHHVAIARPTVDGRRLVQCLRCGTWAVVDPPVAGSGRALSIDELAQLERPRRGKALRQAVVLRVISVDRAFHTLAFAAAAIAALAVRWNIDAIHGWAASMLDALSNARAGRGGVNAHGLTAGLLTRLANVDPHSLAVLAAIAAAYAVVSGFETVGLWRGRRWAEYLTALSTAGFLPFELHELIERVTFVRVATLVINLAILGYLVFAKHLFGIRGPLPEPESPPVDELPDLAGFVTP
jgi:uncharacterized membrane protein (DUF2068 family)